MAVHGQKKRCFGAQLAAPNVRKAGVFRIRFRQNSELSYRLRWTSALIDTLPPHAGLLRVNRGCEPVRLTVHHSRSAEPARLLRWLTMTAPAALSDWTAVGGFAALRMSRPPCGEAESAGPTRRGLPIFRPDALRTSASCGGAVSTSTGIFLFHRARRSSSQSPLGSVSASGENCTRCLAPPLPAETTSLGFSGSPASKEKWGRIL